MNKELRELFDEKNIITKKITLKNNVRIIDNGKEQFVIKRREKDLKEVYRYLKSRAFLYFPEIVYQTEHYDVYRYVEDALIPVEERAQDIIKLVTLLHSKTTFYRDIDDDTYKELYETVIENLEYLQHYYSDLADVFEQEEYMSPSHYLFMRNISKLFASLFYCRDQLEKWYDIIEEKKRVRVVHIHNNLSLDHYLSGEQPYLISWRNSKKDLPIYDLFKFYKRYCLELDFCELIRSYERHYPLLEEEKILFFCLISIPEKIEFDNQEFLMCQRVQKFYDYLFATDKLIQDYFPRQSEKRNESYYVK